MAITAINSISRSPSRFAAFTGAKGIVIALTVAAGLTFHVSVQAADYMVGIVTQGTFLVSEEANVKREGKLVHGLVGYLPIGTRVYVREESKTINNLTEGQPERYYPVLSSIGVHGLLREDRFIRVKDKPIAVVVSSKQVVLHNPDPQKGPYKKLLELGRYDNAYLEITSKGSKTHHYAILKRMDSKADLPRAERVRLWKDYVRNGAVIMVRPQQPSKEQSLPVPVWSEKEKLDNSLISQLIERIGDRLGENLKKARMILGEADTIQCLIKASAEAKAGFEVYGNGLSFNLDMPINDRDQMFRLMRRELTMGSEEPTTYLILQNVKCDGATPERLYQFTLEADADFRRRTSVRLKDLEKEEESSKWVTSLQGRNVPFRMVRIANEQGYMGVLRQLDKFASTGDSFISEVSSEEREVLLNLIVREISYFEHRDNLIPSSDR